jgi:hypothetical protein
MVEIVIRLLLPEIQNQIVMVQRHMVVVRLAVTGLIHMQHLREALMGVVLIETRILGMEEVMEHLSILAVVVWFHLKDYHLVQPPHG